MNKEARKILAIDYGEARIGLALADDEVKIASGLDTLKNDQKMYHELEDIISLNKIDLVIIGKTSTPISRKVDSLKKLETYLLNKGLEIAYQEEMFTTIDAQRILREKGIKNVSKEDNREAARIILQDWLDRSQG